MLNRILYALLGLFVSRAEARISASRMMYATTVKPADRETARQWMGR